LSFTEGLPAEVEVLTLAAAMKNAEAETLIRGRLQLDENNTFLALNTALFEDGLFLRIPAELALAAPIQLLFLSESNRAERIASFPRVIIEAGTHSSATIVETYASHDAEGYLTNAVIDFVLGDGARVTHYKVQRESTDAFHVATTRADLGRASQYFATSINLGAALSRHDIEVQMDHQDSECAVDGLYMIDGHQHSDTHSVIDHRQPHCTSHQLYKGILDGKSRAVFNGKVFVRHGAQQTDAQQTNKNLLLSNQAQVDTKPQLEIYADDVKCTHGAAVGQLDDDEMFYLASRGINPALAKNMLTYGFAEEVIEKINIDSIKRELDEAVLNRLHTDLT
jgi:Fe-S cluster assembly protein SufD